MATKVFVASAAAAAAAALLAACTEEPATSPAVEQQPAAEAPAAPAQQNDPAAAAGGDAGAAAGGESREEIVAERGGFIPEGIEYDNTSGRILVGSLAEGSIFAVADDGSLTVVVTDPELVSSVGIEADETRDRLLVANSDRAVFQGGSQGQAKLGIYNLTTGERIAMVDLQAALGDTPDDAAFFANDVAVGDDGTAYVTDTQQNVVYRVGTDNTASVLYRFEGEGPGLNGIVYEPGGYLLVVGGPRLFKIPVENPESMSEVMLAEPVEGGDGMVWTADGRLAVVSNSTSRVIALTSNDDWASAEVAGVAPFQGQGTTAAVVGDDIYVVKPHFADQDPPSIERVTFE